MKILGFDTSATCCSAALLCDGEVVAEKYTWEPRSHATMLVPMIRDILDSAGALVSELNGIALSSGPGSYTGLRIGTSTAKGLCIASGAPLLAVETTTAFAVSAIDRLDLASGLIAVLMQSRRGEVYAAAYSFPDMDLVHTVQPLPIKELPDLLDTDSVDVATGDVKTILTDYLPEAVHVPVVPLGPTIARLGLTQLEKGNISDIASFEPDYLKPVATTRPRAIFQQR